MTPIRLPELSRDLVLLVKGDSMTVAVDPGLAASGWPGGMFAKYTVSPTGFPTVMKADGRYCGFFIFGSDEDADQLTGMELQNVVYSYVVLQFGGNVAYVRVFETLGYAARHGGPQTALVYTPNQLLYISENGLVTNENESDLGTYGAHNFPDGVAVPDMSFVAFGLCFVPPSILTNGYLGIQTNIGV